jgi:DNA replication protein DnaC
MDARAKIACPKCKDQGYTVSAQGEHAVASLCSCQSQCPRCDGTGRAYELRDGYQFASICSCQQLRRGIALHNEAKLPAVLAGRDLDSVKPHFAELETALEIARNYCHRFIPKQTKDGLLFSGPVGTGKTHLLSSILRYMTVEKRVKCRYVEISFLYSEIRGGFSQNRSSLDIIAPLADVPLLAIDELGKGKMSPFEQETIDELISRRYNGGKPTLLATNYQVGEEMRPKERFSSSEKRAADANLEYSLKERVGERVYSRLHQMCKFVIFPGTAMDYRRMTARV